MPSDDCPWFEYDDCLRLVYRWIARPGDYMAAYDDQTDAFVFASPDGSEQRFPSHVTHDDRGPVKRWAVGGLKWGEPAPRPRESPVVPRAAPEQYVRLRDARAALEGLVLAYEAHVRNRPTDIDGARWRKLVGTAFGDAVARARRELAEETEAERWERRGTR